MSFRILGTGSFLPKKSVNNDELSQFLDTSDEWITERTGIRSRYVCTDETASALGIGAARAALADCGVTPGELDLILCTSCSGESVSPSMACLIQRGIGASCPAIEINAACSAFIYMLDVAAGYFARGKVKRVLAVSTEQISRIVDWTDRSTCVIFGDGAGAAVLGDGDGYIDAVLNVSGGNEVIDIPNYMGNSPFYSNERKSPYIMMKGQETFKFAVNAMQHDISEVLSKCGYTENDVDFVVAHQANKRIIDYVKRKMNIADDKFICNIERYGNTSSASVPIALDELNKSGRLKRGDLIVAAAFGGGLSDGACLIRW